MEAMSVPLRFIPPQWVLVLDLLIGAALFAGIAYSGIRGWWWLSGPLALLTCYGVLYVTRCVIEPEPASKVFSPGVQAWTVLFVNGAIALVIMLCSWAWGHSLHPLPMFTKWWWPPVCYLIGCIASALFYYLLDKSNYVRAGAEAVLTSPGKLGFMLITYIAMMGAFACVAVPVLVSDMWSRGWFVVVPALVVAVVVGWLAVGVLHDGARKPDGSPMIDPFAVATAWNYVDHKAEPGFRMPVQSP